MPATTFSIEGIGSAIGTGSADLKETTINIIQWVLGFLILIAVFWLIVGGVNWIASGDSDVVKTRARRQITYALIAIVICLLAWAIVTFVVGTTINVTN